MSFKSFLKQMQKEESPKKVSAFNDKLEMIKLLNENLESNNVRADGSRKDSIDITKLNVYNKYVHDNISKAGLTKIFQSIHWTFHL